MSSILKKSSLSFKPKVKPQVKKPVSLPTPPSTQQESVTQRESNDVVGMDKPAFNLGLQPSPKEKEEEVIDPKDSSNVNDKAIGSDSDSDNDMFKLPENNRRSSTQRRLSGINTPGMRSRSASISLNSESSSSQAAKIGIPTSKAVKRRRSSIQATRAKKIQFTPNEKEEIEKKKFTQAAPISKIINGPTDDNQTEKHERNEERIKRPVNYVSDEFVVGLDPISNKLRKYRRKGVVAKKEESKDITATATPTEEDLLPEEPEDLITTITSIHQIPKDIKQEDLGLYAEVDFSLEEMTMAELCKPTLNLGKVSSNYQLIIEAEEQLKQKKLQRKLDREYARKKKISLEEAQIQLEKEQQLQNGGELESEKKEERNTLFDNLEQDEPKQHSSLKLVMQNGKINFDADSQIVTKARADASTRTYEESNPYANPITSITYSKRVHSERWQPEELIQFYRALSMFGTDFSLIAQLFPHRTRKQVKSKFTLEEKKFPEIVELALKRKLPVDFDMYCEDANQQLKTLEQFNEELKQMRLKHEKDMAEMLKQKQQAMEEDKEVTRRREVEIRTGAKPMTKAERIQELRKNEQVVGTIDDIKRERNASVSIN